MLFKYFAALKHLFSMPNQCISNAIFYQVSMGFTFKCLLYLQYLLPFELYILKVYVKMLTSTSEPFCQKSPIPPPPPPIWCLPDKTPNICGKFHEPPADQLELLQEEHARTGHNGKYLVILLTDGWETQFIS